MEKYLPEGKRFVTQENHRRVTSAVQLREAFSAGETLEARAVLCDSEHNLYVQTPCMRGFMPHEECALGIKEGTVRDIAVLSRVNKPICFHITSLKEEPDGKYAATLSRRSVQKDCMENYIRHLRPGDVIDARITHLESFGAFCDIGAGVSALLPIDSISVSRIPHPSARFKVHQDIKAVVKGIDENGRITLSHKELLGTWAENAARLKAGETVPGMIRSVEEYGIFVELAPNLAGLAEFTEGKKVGDCTSVYIKSINPYRMKIKLIIVDAFEAEYESGPPQYFVDAPRLSVWRYSPPECEKVIETVF